MKKIIYIALLLFYGTINAQNNINDYIQEIVTEAKDKYPVDSKDLTVNKLFDEFYYNILESETGEISEELVTKISTLVESPNTKNMHILTLLLVFQGYINETEENNEIINTEFQLKLVEALENEFKALNQNVPILVYIYKIESLQNNEMFTEADELTDLSFKKFPNSVPLKVFQYLATSDENLRNDLILNHSNHWFVKQLESQL